MADANHKSPSISILYVADEPALNCGADLYIQKRGADILYQFSDDGIGFPDDIDFQNTTTLGMELVNNLVMQLMGTISLYREEGTRFEIIFPVRPAGVDEQ